MTARPVIFVLGTVVAFVLGVVVLTLLGNALLGTSTTAVIIRIVIGLTYGWLFSEAVQRLYRRWAR